MTVAKVIVKLVGGDVDGIDVEGDEPIQVEVRQYHRDFQEGPDEPDRTREFDWDGELYYEVLA